MAVYDLLGREVAVLVDGRREGGTYRVQFDGGGLSSGVYLYRIMISSPGGSIHSIPAERREAGSADPGEVSETRRLVLTR